MADLSERPTLRELQQYVADVCQERGWTKDNPAEKFLLFVEEVLLVHGSESTFCGSVGSPHKSRKY